MADKKATKLRRRGVKQDRVRDKATREGESPAQKAEAIRHRESEDPKHAMRRAGLDGSVGGDTARNRPSS